MYSQRFSTRLILGFFSLIVLSALGAGAPAYWLTRRELEQQAWANVQNAQQATLSLLQAEQLRLLSLATLFSERPTLHRLARDGATAELTAYLTAFQQQSQLDFLLFCANNGQIFAGKVAVEQCPIITTENFVLWGNQPVLLSRQPIEDALDGNVLGTAIVGIDLDNAFWQQMRVNTGVEQSLLAPSGLRLASSITGTRPSGLTTPALTSAQSTATGRYQLNLAGRQFYAYVTALTKNAPFLQLEVALPVDELLAAEQRAFTIFMVSIGLIATLGVLLAAGYVRRLTRPLWQLTQAAERIGKGNFVAAIPAFVAPLEVATLSTALIKSQATMLRALEERSDFLAGVSHEFQTPLSTLQAALELVADEQEDLSAAEMREVLKPAQMSLSGLKNLIDNLLQSSSIEAGQFTMRKRATALAAVIEDARRLVQPLLDRRRQPLQWPTGDDWPLLQADPARLTQVLVNLLANASKYSPVGTQIDLTVAMQENYLRIAVADRGVGIPAGERVALFQRFVRMAAQAGEQPGVGLGLYVVKTIVEAHGGAVGVEERAGGGSIFWFTLPVE